MFDLLSFPPLCCCMCTDHRNWNLNNPVTLPCACPRLERGSPWRIHLALSALPLTRSLIDPFSPEIPFPTPAHSPRRRFLCAAERTYLYTVQDANFTGLTKNFLTVCQKATTMAKDATFMYFGCVGGCDRPSPDRRDSPPLNSLHRAPPQFARQTPPLDRPGPRTGLPETKLGSARQTSPRSTRAHVRPRLARRWPPALASSGSMCSSLIQPATSSTPRKTRIPQHKKGARVLMSYQGRSRRQLMLTSAPFHRPCGTMQDQQGAVFCAKHDDAAADPRTHQLLDKPK